MEEEQKYPPEDDGDNEDEKGKSWLSMPWKAAVLTPYSSATAYLQENLFFPIHEVLSKTFEKYNKADQPGNQWFKNFRLIGELEKSGWLTKNVKRLICFFSIPLLFLVIGCPLWWLFSAHSATAISHIANFPLHIAHLLKPLFILIGSKPIFIVLAIFIGLVLIFALLRYLPSMLYYLQYPLAAATWVAAMLLTTAALIPALLVKSVVTLVTGYRTSQENSLKIETEINEPELNSSNSDDNRVVLEPLGGKVQQEEEVKEDDEDNEVETPNTNNTNQSYLNDSEKDPDKIIQNLD